MQQILIRFFLTILSAFISFFNLSVDIPGQSSGDFIIEPSIVYHNEEAGNADALIQMTANIDGEYDFYWADENGEYLQMNAGYFEGAYSSFATVDVLLGKGSVDLPDFTAIPVGARNILVCRDELVLEQIEIPADKQSDFGDLTYSFGVISDLHFNRYAAPDETDVAEYTFANSLNFFETCGVSMVAMPGDISTDGEVEAFQSFNKIASDYDFNVFTTTGNHDLHAKFRLENWQAYMNAGVYGEEKLPGVLAVSDNGLDFVYSGPETGGDVFIFLSQTTNNYGMLINALLRTEQLDWLEEQFETYSDSRVYLFFHTFLTAPGCNPMMGCGNLMNEMGWSYPLFYTPGASDEVRFRNLLRSYDNVVFFSGHSHWAFHMQELNAELNIADYNEGGATYVHVSSVSSPRTTEELQILWSGNDPAMSEGYLVQVYEDCIVLVGCDFINDRPLAYATYRIEK